MRAEDLNLRTMLEFSPSTGRLLLGDERMIIFRTRAFAHLRRLLFDQLGRETARALLLQFGRLCGAGDFDAIGGDLAWDTPEDRAMAGPLLHGWEGIVAVVPDTKIAPGMARMTGTWLNSYEAEMHLEEFGRADEPVCYTLQGYAHGHASRAHGVNLLCVETACRAMGDPQCRWEVRPDAQWGDHAVAASLRRAFAATPESIQRRLEQQVELARRQREVMAAMATPVLEVWDHVLVLPVIGAVDSQRAAAMMEALLGAITARRARCTILDLTGVDTIDTHSADHLMRLIRSAVLLGSECVVSGISPTIAQTLIQLDIAVGFRSFSSLKDALQHAIVASRAPTGGAGSPR